MFFLLYGVAVVWIGLILYWILEQSGRKEETKKLKRTERTLHVRMIKEKFPRAFKAYWYNAALANSVISKYSNSRLSADSRLWTDRDWRILEEHLMRKEDEESDRKANEPIVIYTEMLNRLKDLKEREPAKYEQWKRENPELSIEAIEGTIDYLIKLNKEQSKGREIKYREYV